MKSTYKKHRKSSYRKSSYKKHRKSTYKKHRKSTYKKHRKSTRKSKRMCGGFGPGAGPLGYAWVGKDVSTWPGVAGVPGQSNFLPLSKDGVPAGLMDPAISTRNNVQGGGGGLTDLLPQDLVNFGRSLTGGVQGMVYGYQGVERPYSTLSSPTNQPGMNASAVNYSNSMPPNISAIHQAAGRTVAAI